MTPPVCHLASSSTPLVAVGGFESAIEMWDLQTTERVGTFSSVLDFGGRRLALDAAGTTCFAASYSKGVTAYTASGAVVWQRADVKKVKSIVVGSVNGCLHVATDGKRLYSLDARDGSTREVQADTRGVVEDATSGARFVDSEPLKIVLKSGMLHEVPRTTFAVLDVVFGRDSVCISESGGATRCFNLGDGQEKWAWRGGTGKHIVRLGYNVSTDRYYGVVLVVANGEKALASLGASEVEEEVELGTPFATEFCLGGEALLLSDGRLLSTSTGALLRNLPFFANTGG